MKWRMQTLRVVMIGDGVPLETRDRIGTLLGRMFGFACRFEPRALDPTPALNSARGQYHSTSLLHELARFSADAKVLGITTVDLFVPVLTFVFGEAQLPGRCALVSSHRLREEFYGLPARADLLEQRLIKEAMHELGHTYGLRHCDHWECVMASTHSVERLDVKLAEFCPECRKAIRARMGVGASEGSHV